MNRWRKAKQRLLAGALCAALVFESVNVTAYAAQQYETDASVEAAETFDEDGYAEEMPDIVTEPEEQDDEETPEEEQLAVDADTESSEQTAEESVEEEETRSSEAETESVSGTEALESDTSKLVIVEGELDGVYQFGGAPSERKSAEDSLKAAAGEAEISAEEESRIADYLYREMMERKTTIDISAYQLSWEEAYAIAAGVLNEHPDLYFVGKKIEFSTSGSSGKCISLRFTYDSTLDDAAFQRSAKAALACVKPGMSDLEKAIVLHDYLAVNCAYDYENYLNGTIPSTSYSAYGTLVMHTAVCEGYALAYKYLLNKVGINCYMVTSDTMNHAWNLIELNGKYYQVDVTWDDPTWDKVGRAVHTYMFRSDSAFQKHSDWEVTSGATVVDYKATDTSYDNAFWANVTSPLVLIENGCYYVTYDSEEYTAKIKKTALSDVTAAGEDVCDIGVWTAWENENSFWQNAFSGLFCVNNRLYYNDKSSIYSISPDGSDKRTEFTADTTGGYIYGSALCGQKVYYALHTTPNFNEKETTLVADITLPFDDTEEEGSSSAESGSAPESTSAPEGSSSPESDSTPGSSSVPESYPVTGSGSAPESMPESTPTTEGSSAPENNSEPEGNEGSSTPESNSTPEDSSAPEDEKTDGRLNLDNAGVLFPGKKADDYSVVYTGEKICPVMIVTYTYQDSKGRQKLQTLKLNTDYTVRYKNNVNAGKNTATVTVTGIGEYAGTVEKTFTIRQKSISKVTLSAVGDIKYGEEPAVTVMDGAKELVKDTDYTIELTTTGSSDADKPSELTVKGKGNYTDVSKKKAKFNILKTETDVLPITDETLTIGFKKFPAKGYTYNGKAQKPAVVVTDKDGKPVSSSSYKVIYSNNVNAGKNTAEAYVVGVTKKGAGYYGISAPLKFTINPKSFGKISASVKGTIPKFGTLTDIQKAINEAVVVKDGKTVLSYGEDYTINYGGITSFDGIAIGTKYEISILPTGKNGNYTSDDKKTIKIKIKFGQLNLASKTAVTTLTITNVEEKKAALTYNGKELKQDRDYTVTSIKQDKKTELYTVKIKAVKGSAYKGSLTFKNVSFKALSMTLDKAWITGEMGETIRLNAVVPPDVQLSTITWESSNQSVAAVTNEGLVSLTGSGMAVITARADAETETGQIALTAQCQVVVKGKMEDGDWIDVTEYGAVPDDGQDDWDAIQGALEHSENHTAYIPAGTYNIDLEKNNGIVMRKNYKLYMHKDAVLQAMKTDKGSCQVINVGSSGHLDDPDYYSNIEISGGTIIGDLREAKVDGDGVMGIRVQYAKNVYIHDVTVKECRGDGIYIGGNGKGSTNICITGCTIMDNSRNCLGIVNAHNLYVDNCKISGAGRLFGGKAPRACILIEKNEGDDVCTDIVIKNSEIDNKDVCEREKEAYAFGSALVRNNEIQGDRLTVENCTFKGRVANYSTKNAKFINCTFDRDPIWKQNTIVE